MHLCLLSLFTILDRSNLALYLFRFSLPPSILSLHHPCILSHIMPHKLQPRPTPAATARSPPPRTAVSALPIPHGWRLAAAGGMAGMVTNSILHPLDTVKTVRQTDPRRFGSMASTLRAIVSQRGPAALYAGLIPALVGSSISSAIYFGIYELAKTAAARIFPTAWNDPRSRVPLTAVSAACGNVSSSFLLVPKEVVKQRMQSGVAVGNSVTVITDLIRQSGPLGLYRGYKATLLRNVPSTMLRFAVYEEAKLAIRRLRPSARRDDPLSSPEFITAGSIAGAFSSACTTPMDVVKTGFATGRIKQGAPLIPAFRDIVRSEGVGGLFVGVRPRVIWSALFAAIGFTSYEICKKWLVEQRRSPRTRYAVSSRAVPVSRNYGARRVDVGEADAKE